MMACVMTRCVDAVCHYVLLCMVSCDLRSDVAMCIAASICSIVWRRMHVHRVMVGCVALGCVVVC